MKINEIKRLKKFTVTNSIRNISDINLVGSLIKHIKVINYDLSFKYLDEIQTLKVSGPVNFVIIVVDSRTGIDFEYLDEILWEEEYSFSLEYNSNSNIVIGEIFPIETYLIQQINLHIPLNLSKECDTIKKTGFGWTLLSESQYDNQEDEIPDPRWQQLEKFKK